MKTLLEQQIEIQKELIAHLRTVALSKETTKPWNRRRIELEAKIADLEQQRAMEPANKD
jgi:hypothetical protein